MKNKLFVSRFLLMGLLMAGACSDHDDTAATGLPDGGGNVLTVNVDVVLPASIAKDWQNAIDWALENIEEAQLQQKNKVRLNLRYHDEDTENLDSLARRLAQPEEGDDTCHAILGPYHSSNAQTFLSHAAQRRLPVVMPTCTSAELQRVNARNNYAWFLTESDVTQCEIMLSAVKTMNCKDVALIYSNDTYGQTFYDYFGFFAAEFELNVAGRGIIDYTKGDDLTAFFRSVSADSHGTRPFILLALSDPDDYIEVNRQLLKFANSAEVAWPPMSISADVALNEKTIQSYDGVRSFLGVSPVGELTSGFPQSYRSRFRQDAYNGVAQVYDALVLIAIGAAFQQGNPETLLVYSERGVELLEPGERLLTDYMRGAIMGVGGAKSVNWTRDGLATAFAELNVGRFVSYTGALGQLYLDSYVGTKNMNTVYMLWNTEDINHETDGGVYSTISVVPICYMTNKEYGNGVNSTLLWEIEKSVKLTFDDDGSIHLMPAARDYWAVVIATSTTWNDYRHQADALAMYQLLRRCGYDDDHIVLIVEDNLAYDPRNSCPGEIFVDLRGIDLPPKERAVLDVRKGAQVDYHFSDLKPDDLADILTGRSSDRLPHVISPDSLSNVFVFWSGHGGEGEGPLWGNESEWTYFGQERIRSIVEKMSGHYRRMFMAVEACFSGKWGECLLGIPDLLVLTAASPYETSKAEGFSLPLGIFLTNGFTRSFMQGVSRDNTISVYNLFAEVLKATNGSHVSLYNGSAYGSVYSSKMSEYFPEPARQW